MGMKVGYARVSTVGQKLDVQMDHLADCDHIFREKASASSTKNRPELKNALDFVREEGSATYLHESNIIVFWQFLKFGEVELLSTNSSFVH